MITKKKRRESNIQRAAVFFYEIRGIKQYSFTIIGYDSIEAWLNYYISNGRLLFHFFEVDFEKWVVVFFHLFLLKYTITTLLISLIKKFIFWPYPRVRNLIFHHHYNLPDTRS